MGGVVSGRFIHPGFKGGITLADLVHVLPLQSVSDEAQEALSKIEYLEGDSATKVKEYDGVVRSLWEVNQLYEQFRWNYGELRRLVPCDRSDSRFQIPGRRADSLRIGRCASFLDTTLDTTKHSVSWRRQALV